MPLRLPPLERLELVPDPKQVLYDALRVASELAGRHLRRFNPRAAVHLLAGLIEDFSPLRSLSAFRAFEDDVLALVREPLLPR